MARKKLKLNSTNLVELPDVKDEVTGTYFTDTNCTVSLGALLDANKQALGSPVSLTWTYVAGAISGVATVGVWRAAIADTVALTDATAYYARVKFTGTGTLAGIVRTAYVALITQADDN